MYRPLTADSRDNGRAIIVRPSSASAKLQSHVVRRAFDDNRPATTSVQTSLSAIETKLPASQRQTTHFEHVKPSRHERRLTISETTGIGNKAELLIRLNTPSSTTGKIKVEERITLEQLHQIKAAFEEADTDGSGTLDIDEFKMVVQKSLGIRGRNEEQIIALFMKIDSSSDGEIDWDEFCTYMQLEYAEKEEAMLRSKRILFHLPALVSPSHVHKTPVLRILHIGDSTFMCCSKDGLLSFWTHDLKLKKEKSIATEASTTSSFSIKPSLWVTDVGILPNHNKLTISTGDRDIHFYELSTLELCCRITGFDSIPLCMDVCEIERDLVMITYGDDQGCVGILEMRKVGETLRLWKKAPVINGMPTIMIQDISMEEHIYYIKWKVHDDWIARLKYYHDLHSVVSSCNQTATALVRGCTRPSTSLGSPGLRSLSAVASNRQASRQSHRRHHGRHTSEARKRQPTDQTVFTVYKGVSTFDFCKERNIIATGGMDRILRLWNPYIPHKPTGYLRGHNSPIFFVAMSGVDDRVFSVSADKVVKVWDLIEQTCLVTLSPKLHKIRGDILTSTYTEANKSIAIVTDHISLLRISQKVNLKAEMPTSHTEAVTCIGYNSSFNHVITCSEGSVVKLWDFDNGLFMFEFNKAHGDSAITSMNFDKSGRRLVTSGRDGAMRIWNYNNGHCLRSLIPEGEPHEVSTCLYIETNRNNFIVGAGWDRMINVFPDDVQDFRTVQRPENKWKDYERVGHKDDIIASAYGPPNLLATVSYEGTINIWNFVSRNIVCILPYPRESLESDSSSDGDDSGYENEDVVHSVSKLIFIKKRIPGKVHATLIAACTNGILLFWSVQDGKIFTRCSVTQRPCSIGGLVLDEDENTLFIGDDLGFVRVWNIENYALSQSRSEFDNPPPLLRGWRCHIKKITDICLVEKHSVILTSSIDCTVRMWKTTSEYIGTFGQTQHWDLYDEMTWLHPMVPDEVLFDPQSMPDHPILKEMFFNDDSLEPSDSDEVEDVFEQAKDSDDKKVKVQKPPKEKKDCIGRSSSAEPSSKVVLTPRRSSRVRTTADDIWRKRLSRRLSRTVVIAPDEFRKNEEENMLTDVKQSMVRSAGKRLRHERLLSYQRRLNLHLDAGSHAFQSLKCFDLQEPGSDVKETLEGRGDSLSLLRSSSVIKEEELSPVAVN